MPFSKSDSSKLKTSLKLCSTRMAILQKKKTEIGQKSRREIAEILRQNKVERARIKTEQIVREDYVAEALEILQTYCDLILTRFGIFEAKNEVDPALETAISTLIWSTPRLNAEVSELDTITKLLTTKYSKPYIEVCTENKLHTVSTSVIAKLDLKAPSPQLVEMYMVEIARTYEVSYKPNLSLLNPGNCANDSSYYGDTGGGDEDGKEEQLINFNPMIDGGLPQLPSGFNTIEAPWDHGETSAVNAPYPEFTPFPSADSVAPPVPESAPVPPDPTSLFDVNPKPPSYDATMFSEKLPLNQETLPGFNDLSNKKSDLSSESDEDFEQLQKRFNELTKKN